MISEAAITRVADLLRVPDLRGREAWIVYSKEEQIIAGLLAGAQVDGVDLTLWIDAAIVVAPFPIPCHAREKGLLRLDDAFFEGSLEVRRAGAEGIVVMRSFFGSETCLVVDRARAVDFNGLPWTSRQVEGRGVDGSPVLSGSARKPWRLCCSFCAADRTGSTVEVMFDPSHPIGIAVATRGGHVQVGRVEPSVADVVCTWEGDALILGANKPGALAVEGRDVARGDRCVVPLGSSIRVREAQGRMTISARELYRWREPLAGFDRTIVWQVPSTARALALNEFLEVV